MIDERRPGGPTVRKWLVRGGVALVIAAMVLMNLGGVDLFDGAFGHWSVEVAFYALLAAVWAFGEWLIGRGYRHRTAGQPGNRAAEPS